MKSLIIRAISIIAGIAALFLAGSNSGRRKEKSNQIERTLKNVKKSKDIEKSINKLSRVDKLKRL